MNLVATAPASRVREAAAGQLPAVALGLAAAPVLAANGGYFPTSWGWAGLALAWGAVAGASLRPIARPAGIELGFLGGLGAFAAWSALSSIWGSPSAAALEVERTLVYLAAPLALQVLVHRRHVAALLGGVCAGIIAISGYALITRLFPRGSGGAAALVGNRLATPLGYWNGLGLVAGMGVLLALGFSARGGRASSRAVAAACVPVALMTLYFTFSRGASISMLAGMVALVALDRRRLQLLGATAPVAAIAAVAVWRASRETALTHLNVSLGAASHDGRRLAIILLGAMAAAACTAVLTRRAERAVHLGKRSRIVIGGVLIAIVLVAVSALFIRFGSPASLAHRGYRAFVAPPSSGVDLNTHLFSLSNNNRIAAWRVAWHAFEEHPLGGIGSGGFEQYWDQRRPFALHIRDAHNLYIETMAETGIVGLLILVATLAAPLVGFWRARRHSLAAAALAAYAAFLVEAAVDWDWELSGVTLVALLCGGAVLVAGRERGSRRRRRIFPLILGSLIGVAALLGLGGNLLLALSSKAAVAGNWSSAASDARRAELWAPWSAQPWQQLGEVQLASGQRSQALASFRTAVSKDSGDWTLWVDLARAATGKERAAAFARAHALNPLDPTIAQTESEVGSS
ncbi:MAG TPA: O-antigen ligase family protein [Solirubrobacteraceae bacterium]|jgi:hypothetical protein